MWKAILMFLEASSGDVDRKDQMVVLAYAVGKGATRCSLLLAIALLLVSCAAGPPADVFLIRIDGPWVEAPPEVEIHTRTARATVLLFRGNGEYVGLDSWAIEQEDKRLFMSLGDGHVVAVGSWRREGKGVKATRRVVYRVIPVIGRDPICEQPNVDFVVQADYVTGGVGYSSTGEYRSNSRLQLPEFEMDVDLAKRSGTKCDI